MKSESQDKILKAVRERYAEVAMQKKAGCCSGSVPSCCEAEPPAPSPSKDCGRLPCSGKETPAIPEEADMGLSCGKPIEIAALKPGEVVLDLGSGGGIDCFIASRIVTESGHVIGIDMTPEMVSKARKSAMEYGYKNVEFRLGEIENLPVADASVDVIISNCVINLSPDKPRLFAEAFRALKPGGRFAVADMLAASPLPESIEEDLDLYVSCISGAIFVDDFRNMLSEAGFQDITVQFKENNKESACDCSRGTSLEGIVIPAMITAFKPGSISH